MNTATLSALCAAIAIGPSVMGAVTPISVNRRLIAENRNSSTFSTTHTNGAFGVWNDQVVLDNSPGGAPSHVLAAQNTNVQGDRADGTLDCTATLLGLIPPDVGIRATSDLTFRFNVSTPTPYFAFYSMTQNATNNSHLNGTSLSNTSTLATVFDFGLSGNQTWFRNGTLQPGNYVFIVEFAVGSVESPPPSASYGDFHLDFSFIVPSPSAGTAGLLAFGLFSARRRRA